MSRARVITVVWLLITVIPAGSRAVETQKVVHRTPEAFSKGHLEHVVVTEDGVLSLSPRYAELVGIPDPIIWRVVVDGAGTVFMATGNDGKVYSFTKGDSEAVVLADFEASQVFALAVGAGDVLYAGTSPDGAVYRVDRDGNTELVLDPEANYVWDMTTDEAGRLIVATGSPGGVVRLEANGEIEPILETDETHVLCLALADGEVLYAGTANNGYVYRVAMSSRRPRAEVVFDAPGNEVKDLLVLPDDSVVAMTLGEGEDGGDEENVLSGLLGQATSEGENGDGDHETRVYRILPGRAPVTLWHASDLTGHSLGFFLDRLLVGVGGEGKIAALDLEGKLSFLADCAGNQVTAMARGPGGSFLVGVSNPASLFELEPHLVKKGAYTSDIIDSGLYGRWGRIDVLHELPELGAVSVETRSGNTGDPDTGWSKWQSLDHAAVRSPGARYLQYRLTLALEKGAAPRIREVATYFRPLNSQPILDKIEVMDPDVELVAKEDFRSEPAPRGVNQPLEEPKASQVKKKERGGYQSALWEAHDDDGDQLTYTVELREAGSSRWRTLGENQAERFVNFDATAVADGWYQLRVVARDAPSNLPEEVLEDLMLSEPFPVDHVPPVLEALQARVRGGRAEVRFEARDATTYLRTGRCSIDGGGFVPIFPEDGVFDGNEETFSFSSLPLSAGEHMIVVAVEDWVGNVVTGKIRLTVKEQG